MELISSSAIKEKAGEYHVIRDNWFKKMQNKTNNKVPFVKLYVCYFFPPLSYFSAIF